MQFHWAKTRIGILFRRVTDGRVNRKAWSWFNNPFKYTLINNGITIVSPLPTAGEDRKKHSSPKHGCGGMNKKTGNDFHPSDRAGYEMDILDISEREVDLSSIPVGLVQNGADGKVLLNTEGPGSCARGFRNVPLRRKSPTKQRFL